MVHDGFYSYPPLVPFKIRKCQGQLLTRFGPDNICSAAQLDSLSSMMAGSTYNYQVAISSGLLLNLICFSLEVIIQCVLHNTGWLIDKFTTIQS